MMPGNPAEAIYASHAQQLRGNPNALHALEVALGLSTDPLPVQYVHYLINLAHGDLGTSFSFFPSHVTDIIMTSLPWTIFLVGLASIISFFVGVGLGTVVAWRRGGFLDTVLPPITLLLGSFPFFFFALLLLYLLAFQWRLFPLNGAYTMGTVPTLTPDFVGDVLAHAVLPAAAIVIVSVGGWILGMRNTMINTLAEDYITMAQAKGLTDRRVMLMYAARNALLPQITGFALSLGYLVGGVILIEYIFSYPGVGYLLATAIGSEDYPLIQALLLIITVSVLVANLAADMLYGRLDPRVRAA
jgi:peptide/nickel transport system permease protein